jgi:hypothetical protein
MSNHEHKRVSASSVPPLNQLVIPSEAQEWFSFDDIHQIEIDALPEFFNGRYPSKTPQVYKEYRDFIIQLYRQSPLSYLASTSKFNFFYYWYFNTYF